jgi:hypothetical protein
MIVAAVVVMGIGLVTRRVDNAGRHGAVTMDVVVMLDCVAAWMARMRTEYGDQARENSADQRQKDDCLDHWRASLRMICAQTFRVCRVENRYPLFRIMLSPSSD